jgi:hypothetical protein
MGITPPAPVKARPWDDPLLPASVDDPADACAPPPADPEVVPDDEDPCDAVVVVVVVVDEELVVLDVVGEGVVVVVVVLDASAMASALSSEATLRSAVTMAGVGGAAPNTASSD